MSQLTLHPGNATLRAMPQASITFLALAHDSPEFEPVYHLFSRDIPAEFLEEKEFLRNRLRVRDRGPQTEKEKLLIQDGYTLHLIAAMERGRAIGAIYGHLISKIGPDNRGACFVTYISVPAERRRKGIGAMLIRELRRRVNEDSRRLTDRPLAGIVYEIEHEGKEEMKGLARKLCALPLDIVYLQPALRAGAEPQPMQLWFQPLAPELPSIEGTEAVTYPAEFIRSLVSNLLTMEYVGAELNGFDIMSRPYRAFLKSLELRSEIGFLTSLKTGNPDRSEEG